MAAKYRRAQAPAQRALRTLLAVLPRSVRAQRAGRDTGAELVIGDRTLRVQWIGEGNLGDARRLLVRRRGRPDIAVARRLSPGAREALSAAGIGWVDETGAAEITVGSILVSRIGRPPKPVGKPTGWAPAVLAVAEALLCGTHATVSATATATGLSSGSCTHALRVLTDLGLLEARAQRGRWSARQLSDPDRLLEAYASAAGQAASSVHLQVGVTWRDPVAGLAATGSKWSRAKLRWAATGTAAAAVIAPYLTAITSTEVFVDAENIPGLEAASAAAGLRPLEGGRLTLRSFPSVAVRQLATRAGGIWLAPWPRVYVDLRGTGVRGEEAALHLLEVLRAG